MKQFQKLNEKLFQQKLLCLMHRYTHFESFLSEKYIVALLQIQITF